MHLQRLSFLILLSISLQSFASYLEHENAVMVIVPVADAVGTPLQNIQDYDSLAFSPETGPHSCPRIHQFVFNEVGICKQLTPEGTQMLVEFPHLFCETESREKKNQFWLLSKNVMPLKALRGLLQRCSCIPTPIQSNQSTDLKLHADVLTLILPWQDPETDITYSAGTRFKRAQNNDTEHSYGVYLIDCKQHVIKTVLINREISLLDYPKDNSSAKKLFVEIIKKWANILSEKIAYVWGGCSIIKTYPENAFNLVSTKKDENDVSYWMRPSTGGAKTGFDCTGLVLRAAQIAGLPYYCKNTVTLDLNGRDLLDGEQLQEGDLILLPRHVLVVSSIKENKLIQAVSYSSGYGVLHEIALSSAFENITTFEELYRHCKNGTPLRTKKKNGEFLRVFETFRLLKL